MNLLLVEMRRALHRRFVWGLLALAGVGIALMGVIAFTSSAGKSLFELTVEGDHPAVITNWWIGHGEGLLVVAAFPLFIGGLLGGATVAGAEWKAGTITTVLTWEPNRLRLHAARATSAFLLATVIAFVLQAVFLAAALPAVFAHGSTAGADAEYWGHVVAAMVRIAILTGGTALLGFSLATIGRNTAFGLVVAFGWMAVAEGIIRGLKPAWADMLIGENIAIALTWAPLDGADFVRSAATAAITLAVYVGAIAVAAAALFRTRDIAGGS